MKLKIEVDILAMLRSCDKAVLSVADMQDISQKGTIEMTLTQRDKVAVDTRATQESIATEITSATANQFITETGATTPYAPYLEYGTGEYAEAGDGRKGGWFYVDDEGQWHFTYGMRPQPFIRPSAEGAGGKRVLNEVRDEFARKMASKWKA